MTAAPAARDKGVGDVRLSVTSSDGWVHNLFLTLDEAERAVSLLDTLLDQYNPSDDED